MPRGENFKAGPERDRHTALIRSKPSKLAINPRVVPPEPELELGTVEVPSKAEKQRASYAMKEIRSAYWQRPTFSSDGRLVAKELPDEYVLEFEDRDEIIEREAPSYDGWTIVLTSFGFALAEPGKFPSLIEPEEIPAELEFVAAGSGTFRLVEPLSVD